MILGIDLGTTNSLAAVWKDGDVRFIPNVLGGVLTPSVVSVESNGTVLTGLAARERLTSHPTQTIACFKRLMGTNKTVTLGKKTFRPEELSALILGSLKRDAEAFLGEPVTEAVITVPAYFNDAQRKATKAAGELAGLKVERLLNEPTAAALAYGLHDQQDNAKILVTDLGGGTFDVSLLEKFEGVMEVRGIAGDNFLGGEDFAELLTQHFLRDLVQKHGLASADLTAEFKGLVRRQAEIAKRALTQEESTAFEIPWKGQCLRGTVTRETFESLAAPLLDRIRAPIERAFRDAGVHPDTVDHVVLAGGATRMPMIRKMVATLFKKFPASHLNPDEIVARGAAIQAGLKTRDAALSEIVFTDVAPFTMGIEAAELAQNTLISGLYAPILERGTVVPASRVETFSTTQNFQTAIEVVIYQGEARLVKDNIKLGKIEIPLPRGRAGEQSIDVRFTYDINGLLDVDVKVNKTGKTYNLLIEGNPGVLSKKEIAARLVELSRLKIHPRDKDENMFVLARAERLYQERLGEERDEIGRWIAAFVSVLDRQDPREIEEARGKMNAYLAALDRSFF